MSVIERLADWLGRLLYGPPPKPGRFVGGTDFTLRVRGDRDYVYLPDPARPLTFERHDGTRITPGRMVTDGGSVPRAAWPTGIDPWRLFPAYLIHDWQFTLHHCDPDYPWSFAAVNDVLAEAAWTLMLSGYAPKSRRNVALIRAGVNSAAGFAVWNRVWTRAECSDCLEPADAAAPGFFARPGPPPLVRGRDVFDE